MFDYDAWKTGGYGDDEVSLSVSFECKECEHEHDDYEATGSKGSDEVIVYCDECGAENSVDVSYDPPEPDDY